MRTPILLAVIAASIPLAACSSYDNGPRSASERPYRDGYNGDRHHYRPGDPYRPGDAYYLSDNDPVYRNHEGRYYCKKPDGTTGAIVGGVAGGVLGNIIAPGGSKTLGTILGAAGGALAGQAIDRNNVRCE